MESGDEDERDLHDSKEEMIEGMVEPKQEHSTLKLSLAGMGLEAPGHLRLSSREPGGGGFFP